MNRATKEFEHSVVYFVSSNSSAGVWDNNHSRKCKSFTLVHTTIYYSFASGVIWPLLLMYAQLHGCLYWMASTLGSGIDTGVKPTEDVLFHRFRYFFT